MTTTNKPNTLFWVIAVIAVLWNIMGAFQYLSTTLWKEEMLATLTEEQQLVWNALPTWHVAIFAIAVWSGLIASLLLIARKKWSVPLFLLSLIAVIVQMAYWLFGTDAMEVFGPSTPVMPAIVTVLGLFFYFYSKSAKAKGWLK